MIEVIEEVGDAPIVDVATDDNELLLVVHLRRIRWQSIPPAWPSPCTLRYTLAGSPRFPQSREGSLQTLQSQLGVNINQCMPACQNLLGEWNLTAEVKDCKYFPAIRHREEVAVANCGGCDHQVPEGVAKPEGALSSQPFKGIGLKISPFPTHSRGRARSPLSFQEGRWSQQTKIWMRQSWREAGRGGWRKSWWGCGWRWARWSGCRTSGSGRSEGRARCGQARRRGRGGEGWTCPRWCQGRTFQRGEILLPPNVRGGAGGKRCPRQSQSGGWCGSPSWRTPPWGSCWCRWWRGPWRWGCSRTWRQWASSHWGSDRKWDQWPIPGLRIQRSLARKWHSALDTIQDNPDGSMLISNEEDWSKLTWSQLRVNMPGSNYFLTAFCKRKYIFLWICAACIDYNWCFSTYWQAKSTGRWLWGGRHRQWGLSRQREAIFVRPHTLAGNGNWMF